MRRLIIFFSILLITFACVIVWWSYGMGVANVSDAESRYFVIPVGYPIRQIGQDLKKEGFIKDPIVFFLYVKWKGVDREIQAGDYKLSGSMSLSEVVDTLTHGTVDIWVTFREGLRAEEYGDILSSKLANYNNSWLVRLKEENGYLFPDTYLIPKDADVEGIISILKGEFYRKVGELGFDENSPELSRIVIIASLIEREARSKVERPVIAGIIQNRLEDGMALQIDATLQYIKGYSSLQKKWWSTISPLDKEIDSPFNTYKYPGLPPGPISNPGFLSLQAASNPVKTLYFYYLHDENGNIHYAQTLAEHNENIRQYLQ